MYLDSETNLETKVQTIKVQDGKETTEEALPSDYRPVAGGALMSHRVEVTVRGVTVTMVLENVEANVPLEDSLFQFPVKKTEVAAR